MKRTWTIIGVGDVPGSLKWYQALRIGQHARGDLPGDAPAVLAPTALAFRAAIADDRVPVTVRLFLILCRALEGKGLGVPERWAAIETETGNARTVNSTVSTSPFLPLG